MPVLKLNDKKETSSSVVAGIRLTKSKYVDPSTVKIDLKELKEEEKLKVASSVDNSQSEPEVSNPDKNEATQDLTSNPAVVNVDLSPKEKPPVVKPPQIEVNKSSIDKNEITQDLTSNPAVVNVDLSPKEQPPVVKPPQIEVKKSNIDKNEITQDLTSKPVGVNVDLSPKEKTPVVKPPQIEVKKSNIDKNEITQDLTSKPVVGNVDLSPKEKQAVIKPPQTDEKQGLPNNDSDASSGDKELKKEIKELKDSDIIEKNKERKKEIMPPNEKPFAGVFGKNEDTNENKNAPQEKASSDSIPTPKKPVKKTSFFGKKKKKVKPMFKPLKKADSPLQPAIASVANAKEKDLLEKTEEKITNKPVENKSPIGAPKITPSAPKPAIAGKQTDGAPVVKPLGNRVPGAKPSMPPKVAMKTPENKSPIGAPKITPSAPKPAIAGKQTDGAPVVKPLGNRVPGAKPTMPPKVAMKTPENKSPMGAPKITPSAPKPAIAGKQTDGAPVVKPLGNRVPGAKPTMPPKVAMKTPENKSPMGAPKITPSAPKPAIAGKQTDGAPVVKPLGNRVPGAKPTMPPKVAMKTPENKSPMGAKPSLKPSLKPGFGKPNMPPAGMKPKLQKTSLPKPVQDDSLLEPTANISAYETAEEAASLGKIEVNSLSNANLFCFYKKNEEWQKAKFAPEPFGVKVGKSSNATIKLDDPDISDIQLVFTEIIDTWVAMDCGEQDMMRVDGYPARQIKLSPNMPYVIQVGDNSIALLLSNSPSDEPELIPPAKKLGFKKDSGMKLSKIKIGEKELPLHIPESLKQGDDKIISGVPAPSFVLTPINDPDNLFAKIEISADTKETTVGRSSKKAKIVVPEKSISRQHAKLELNGKTLLVTDCDTSNGTFINAKEISGPSVAIAGDIVSFGNMPFKVSFE